MRTYRPPVGIPQREQQRWHGWLASVLAHLFLLALIIVPMMQSDFDPMHREGAGGPGPAGGGGGAPGAGAQFGERLRFVAIAPPPTVTKKAPADQLPHPLVPPPPRKAVTPVVAPPLAPVQSAASTGASAGAGVAGAGSGGAGPGSGGGIGSGEGTGRGSSVGQGTGGGNAKTYPPQVRQLFLPPPAPARVRGFHMVARFLVDSTGKGTLLRFTPTPDEGYNVKLRETLLGMRFRPAVRPDGVPVRDSVDIEYLF